VRGEQLALLGELEALRFLVIVVGSEELS